MEYKNTHTEPLTIWALLNKIYKIKDALETKQPFTPIEISQYDLNKGYLYYTSINTDEKVTLKELIQRLFLAKDINGIWHGNGINEQLSISVNDTEKYDAVSSILIKLI